LGKVVNSYIPQDVNLNVNVNTEPMLMHQMYILTNDASAMMLITREDPGLE
jgi:hypothetical protein